MRTDCIKHCKAVVIAPRFGVLLSEVTKNLRELPALQLAYYEYDEQAFLSNALVWRALQAMAYASDAIIGLWAPLGRLVRKARIKRQAADQVWRAAFAFAEEADVVFIIKGFGLRAQDIPRHMIDRCHVVVWDSVLRYHVDRSISHLVRASTSPRDARRFRWDCVTTAGKLPLTAPAPAVPSHPEVLFVGRFSPLRMIKALAIKVMLFRRMHLTCRLALSPIELHLGALHLVRGSIAKAEHDQLLSQADVLLCIRDLLEDSPSDRFHIASQTNKWVYTDHTVLPDGLLAVVAGAVSFGIGASLKARESIAEVQACSLESYLQRYIDAWRQA